MTIRRWSVYRANLDPVVGSEQGKSRPVPVISDGEINKSLNTVNILPINPESPVEQYILMKPSSLQTISDFRMNQLFFAIRFEHLISKD